MTVDGMDDQVVLLGLGAERSSIGDVYDPGSGTYLRLKMPSPRPDGLTGAGITVAIVDSGLLCSHPDISGRLDESVDFTGEGPDDSRGHGTKVALLLLSQVPEARLVNVKVTGQTAAGAEALIAGMNWLRDSPSVLVANMSVGVYRPTCSGHCSLCSAAREAAGRGKNIAVAAGNLPGITFCPAKASDAVLVVAALDGLGHLADYSSPAGPGGFAAPVPNAAALFEWR